MPWLMVLNLMSQHVIRIREIIAKALTIAVNRFDTRVAFWALKSVAPTPLDLWCMFWATNEDL